MNYDSHYEDLVGLVEPLLRRFGAEGSTLYRASNYSLQAGGKRLRPVLCLAACQLLDQSMDPFLPMACALEFLHTASLIHDDLPALDNDDLRRGKPSCHRVFGEGTALLAGDVLVARAFALIGSSPGLSEKARNRLSIEAAMAFSELCDGQVLDLESEARASSTKVILPGEFTRREFSPSEFQADDNREMRLEGLEHRHLLKTGALLRLATTSPFIANGLDLINDEQYQAITNYSRALGLLFQITDDLLDTEGSTASLGKPAHSDERRQLSTFVTLLGIDGAKARCQALHDAAVSALQTFGEKGWFLKELTTQVLNRTH